MDDEDDEEDFTVGMDDDDDEEDFTVGMDDDDEEDFQVNADDDDDEEENFQVKADHDDDEEHFTNVEHFNASSIMWIIIFLAIAAGGYFLYTKMKKNQSEE